MIIPMLEVYYTAGGEFNKKKKDEVTLLFNEAFLEKVDNPKKYNLTEKQYIKHCKKLIRICKKSIKRYRKTNKYSDNPDYQIWNEKEIKNYSDIINHINQKLDKLKWRNS